MAKNLFPALPNPAGGFGVAAGVGPQLQQFLSQFPQLYQQWQQNQLQIKQARQQMGMQALPILSEVGSSIPGISKNPKYIRAVQQALGNIGVDPSVALNPDGSVNVDALGGGPEQQSASEQASQIISEMRSPIDPLSAQAAAYQLAALRPRLGDTLYNSYANAAISQANYTGPNAALHTEQLREMLGLTTARTALVNTNVQSAKYRDAYLKAGTAHLNAETNTLIPAEAGAATARAQASQAMTQKTIAQIHQMEQTGGFNNKGQWLTAYNGLTNDAVKYAADKVRNQLIVTGGVSVYYQLMGITNPTPDQQKQAQQAIQDARNAVRIDNEALATTNQVRHEMEHSNSSFGTSPDGAPRVPSMSPNQRPANVPADAQFFQYQDNKTGRKDNGWYEKKTKKLWSSSGILLQSGSNP